MQQIWPYFIILLFLTPSLNAAPPKPKVHKAVTSAAGLNIPKWQIAVDALYDERLDDFIPGYKVLNVVISNRRKTVLYLNPQRDRWSIEDRYGKKHRGITMVSKIDKNLWDGLPKDIQQKLAYPRSVKPGHIVKIDLFFKKEADLENYRQLNFRSTALKRNFAIKTDTATMISAEKEEPIPQMTTADNKLFQSYEKEKRQQKKISSPTLKEIRNKKTSSRYDPNLDDLTIIMD